MWAILTSLALHLTCPRRFEVIYPKAHTPHLLLYANGYDAWLRLQHDGGELAHFVDAAEAGEGLAMNLQEAPNARVTAYNATHRRCKGSAPVSWRESRWAFAAFAHYGPGCNEYVHRQGARRRVRVTMRHAARHAARHVHAVPPRPSASKAPSGCPTGSHSETRRVSFLAT